MKSKSAKKYSQQYKTMAVNMNREQGYTKTEVARRLDITRGMIYRWERELYPEEFQNNLKSHRRAQKPSADLEEENRRLREENRRLQEERAVLKKAAAFFANEAELKYQFIEAEKANLSISLMCRILNASRSGYYDWLQKDKFDADRQELIELVKDLHKQKRQRIGSRRMSRELCKRGYQVGRYKARSLMREAGVKC